MVDTFDLAKLHYYLLQFASLAVAKSILKKLLRLGWGKVGFTANLPLRRPLVQMLIGEFSYQTVETGAHLLVSLT